MLNWFKSLVNELFNCLTTTLVVTLFLLFDLEIAVFDFLLIFVFAECLSELRDRDVHSGLLIPESTSPLTLVLVVLFDRFLFDAFLGVFSATLVVAVDFDLLRCFVLAVIGFSLTFLVDDRPISNKSWISFLFI